MESMNFTFNVRPIVRSWDRVMVEGLCELIDTGIAYWCDEYAGSTPFPDLFVVQEGEARDKEGPKIHTISVHTLAIGINRILSGECKINKASIGNIATFVATNELDSLDADDLDCIVQAGLYGELVWG